MSTEFEALNQQHLNDSPQQIIELALQRIDNLAISFSGAEDVVLIHMAAKLCKKMGRGLNVFSLDTGRLHPETYRYIDKVSQHFEIKIDIISPKAEALEAFTKEKGLFSFYEDGHGECCGVRKIAPLKRHLKTLDGWITGQRKDQSPGTRNEIAVIELDNFEGSQGPLVKFNPLASWTSKQVWDYIWMLELPYNELHDKGFVSIGCEPCTRAVRPNQHEREGRWWWEESTAKECGLHAGNIISKG